MRKIFVLDTSVLIYDPKAYESFEGNDVLIPITVLDELDKVKKNSTEAGKNARLAIKNIDSISNKGSIHEGISIDNDIVIKIDTSSYGALGPDPTYGDNKILACAAKIQKDNADTRVILVSKDINLRTRARAFELIAQDYEKDKIDTQELYRGFRTIANKSCGQEIKENGFALVDAHSLTDLNPNEYVLFTDNKGKGIASAKRVGNELRVVNDVSPWGLESRSKEQLFAMDMLLDPNIPLVSIIGRAGSGKTLLSVACGLEMVVEKKKYNTFTIYRPLVPMGNDIGYLPGAMSEKLDPWYTSIDDSFAILLNDKSRKKDSWKLRLHQYITDGTISKEAMTYIRGRSLPNSFVLLDEAQNISRAEIKTILTRIGQGSKIILNGDIDQIDSTFLDHSNNGLTYVVDKFRTSPLAAHITLQRGERSPLATAAAEIL